MEAVSLLPFSHTMETFSFLPKSGALNSSVLSHLPSLGRTLHINQSNIAFSGNSLFYEQIVPIKNTVAAFLAPFSYAQIVTFVLCVAWALGPIIRKRPGVTNAAYHGYRSWLEPTFLVQARYIVHARDIISSGYQKVCIGASTSGTVLMSGSTKRLHLWCGVGTPTSRSCPTNT